MVKPYEEEQADRLSERELTTLFTIFSRYIEDTYKQFKWSFRKEGIGEGLTRWDINTKYTKSRVTNTIKKIGLVVEVQEPKRRIVVVVETFPVDDREIGQRLGAQNFPITGKSPRELGRLAKNMFNWVKQQMEKI